jgi:uncharacterized protein (TIRG00374 family)
MSTVTADAPPSRMGATIFKFILFLALGILIIWLSLRGLTPAEKSEIIHSFRIANYNWVILTIILGIFSHILRALRWRLLLNPMGYHPTLKNTFFAVMVGYFANMAFPRLGEVTRCGILTRYSNIPFNKSFGTVITERAIDMILFVLLFFLMIFTQAGIIGTYMENYVYPKLAEKFSNPLFSKVVILSGVMILLSFTGLIWAFRKKIAHSALMQKLIHLIRGFWDGLKSLSQVKQPWLFVFYSLAIWGLYFLMIYVCFFCFPDTLDLSPGAGLSSLVLGSVGIMITPGGIGLYPAIIQETVSLYGVVRTTGLALGWISWTAQTSMILITGGLSLLLLSFNKKHHGKAQHTAG